MGVVNLSNTDDHYNDNDLANVINALYGNDTVAGNGGNDTIFGGYGDDSIDGGAGDNALSGGAGNDSIVGGVGNDTLLGDGGNDTLVGLGGNDVLQGGMGNDQLNGGAGDTTYQFSYNWGSDTITDAGGNDTLDFSAYDINLTVSLDSMGVGTHVGNGPELTMKGGTFIGSDKNFAFWANDSIENVIKGNGNDSIRGSQYDNFISSGAGNDTIKGAGGNDTLDGGTGNDRMEGGTGNDIFKVDAANDIVVENANEGTDTVLASATYALSNNVENMTLTGTGDISGSGNAQDNILTGNSGNNALSGGIGLDTLKGGTGNDLLKGGLGNDTYQFALNDGQDLIQDIDNTAGNVDVVSFDNTIDKSQVAFFMSGSNLQIGYAGSSDQITVQNQSTGTGKVERFELSDGGYLTSNDVNQVIQSMASYATSNGVSFTSLSDVENNAALLSIVANAWHS
jgi:Ca2+-binding RTX toxin-like protein